MSKQTYSVCGCFRRKFKLKEAEIPSEIKDIFDKYSENRVMNVEHFHKFLKEVQGEDKLSSEEAETLFDFFLGDVHKHLNIFHHKHLHIGLFFRYLWSQINSPIPYPPKVYQDMTCPISHYFIYTGHNSYLTGNQINSDSSDVPIIEALKRGVRVIELDIWPNSTKDNVDVLHGGTLTTPVELIKCLKAIKEYAFVASDYPVIITFEDHLTPDLQAKVAGMVSDIFGDLLVPSKSEHFEEFPSPEALKGRVIISTKHPKEYLDKKLSKKEDDGTTVPVYKSSEEAVWGKEIPDFVEKLELEDDEDDVLNENPTANQNLAPEYKHLIAIRAEKMKGGIKVWLRSNSEQCHRVSLNEEKLEKAVVTHGTDIVRFTQRNLVRVYPKASRIDSSNFNPLIGWIHGSQMVAFNMQTHGRSLWLMEGMFRGNGGCGYVKKPDFLLKNGSDETFDPKKKLPVKCTLKVKVYMGEGWNLDFHRTHFDLYSPPDFYAKIAIDGVPADSVKRKTKTIEDNWIPAWNEEFEFPLTVPELAILRIEVHEFDATDKDDFGGQTCLPVSELKTGIRAVPLHDEKGNKYNSVKLLFRFDFV